MPKPHKRIRLRRKRLLLKAAFLFGGALLLTALLAWGAHNDRIRISRISIEGNSVVSEEELAAYVKTQMQGAYARLFPEDNVFIFPRGRIKRGILDEFKRIYDVKVNVVDPISLSITVRERVPYALWCGENMNSGGDGSAADICYFIDEKGFVFARAPVFSDDVYFTAYGALSDAPEDIAGGVYLGEERFTGLMRFRALLEKEGMETTRLVEKGDGDFEFYLRSGGKLIFNEHQDAEKLLRDLVAAMEVKKNEGKANEALEYIDARFDGKVLFKFTR